MIEELEVIALTADLPEHGLKAGDIGTVVLVHGAGEGYEVEFMTYWGKTFAVVSLFPDQIRRIGEHEVRQVRILE